jgi:transposase
MRILALDLGKNKTVACSYEIETGAHCFQRVVTSPSSLHDLIVDLEPARVVFEIGPSAGWLCDLLEALEIRFQVANTAHPIWRWSNTKKKTDRSDALRLAQLSAMHQLPQVHVPGHAVRQWRALIRYRHHLASRRTQIKNRIRAVLEREGESLPSGKKGWTSAALQMLVAKAQPLSETHEDELWRGELWLELQALAAGYGWPGRFAKAVLAGRDEGSTPLPSAGK